MIPQFHRRWGYRASVPVIQETRISVPLPGFLIFHAFFALPALIVNGAVCDYIAYAATLFQRMDPTSMSCVPLLVANGCHLCEWRWAVMMVVVLCFLVNGLYRYCCHGLGAGT